MEKVQNDLSAAILKLREVQRQAETLAGRTMLEPDLQTAAELLNSLNKEVAAVNALFWEQESALDAVLTRLKRLEKRIETLERATGDPIVLRVVKNGRRQ